MDCARGKGEMGVMTWEGLAAMVRASGAQIWGDSELVSGLAKVKVKVALSCPTLCDPMDYTIHGILQARELEWVVSHSLLQGIFPTQGSNPCLLHCRQILYQLGTGELAGCR